MAGVTSEAENAYSTRLEDLVMPFLHSTLMFERSTFYVLFTEFGTFIDYSIGQQMGFRSY